MKNKRNFLIYPLLLMGVLIVFASSCKKDDDDDMKVSVQVVLLTTAIAMFTKP